MEKLKSINPHNGKIIDTYSQDSGQSIQSKIENLQNGFLVWSETSFEKRKIVLVDIANTLENNKETYATLMSKEMGKPLTQAIAEVEKCAWVCNYYAENGADFLKNKVIETDASHSYVSYEPLGILLAVMPWNYPFWQFFRVWAPNLMLGNVVLLKHASNVSGSALALKGIMDSIDLDYRIADVLIASSSRMTAIIEHPSIKAVTVTGSEKAGSVVASNAAKHIKKAVLELGGSNAAIVLNDANIDEHIATIAWSRFQNTGQSCIAGKRFLVQEDIYDTFLQKLINKVKTYSHGNPMEEDTEIGPMSSEKLAKELEKQLKESLAKGAKLYMGGKRNGAFFEPTIVEVEHINVPIFKEETFGPLVAIKRFSSIDEATELSNYNDFGLGVSIYTEDMDRAKTMIPKLNEGAVFINELVKSDPRLPFGGIKKSGFGRELSEDGIIEFANKKTVYIK